MYVDLLEIAPKRKTDGVSIGDKKIAVHDLTLTDIADLMTRFDEVRALMNNVDVAPEAWLKVGPAAVCAIVAAGLDHAGEPAYEARAAKLAITDQAEIILAIMRLTMPDGIGPFVAKFRAAAGNANGEDATPPDTVKVRIKKPIANPSASPSPAPPPV